MSQNFSENAGQNLQVIHSILYKPSKRPKSSSGKVLIPYLIRMVIKFSWVVAAIDQLILLLSIPQMWNLERTIMEFGTKSILIIISSRL